MEYTLEVRITRNADGDEPEKEMVHIIVPDVCEGDMYDFRKSTFEALSNI